MKEKKWKIKCEGCRGWVRIKAGVKDRQNSARGLIFHVDVCIELDILSPRQGTQ